MSAAPEMIANTLPVLRPPTRTRPHSTENPDTLAPRKSMPVSEQAAEHVRTVNMDHEPVGIDTIPPEMDTLESIDVYA